MKVVYSKEKAMTPIAISDAEEKEEAGGVKKRATPGSVAFIPSVVGLIIASEVVKDLCGIS